MTCKNCTSLALKRQFTTRGETTRFVRRLRNYVEDGKITEFPSFTDLSEIEDDASWPDVIECTFGCPDCGANFTFKASSRKPAQWLPTHRRR